MDDWILEHGHAASWIAVVTLFIAFVLTFCPGRLSPITAAIFCSLGTFVNLTTFAYVSFRVAAINYGASAQKLPVVAWLLPVGFVCYAVASAVLLWPFIPQVKAMCYGRILHLLVLPALVLALYFRTPHYPSHPYPAIEFKWLVYGLLWFRIREAYAINPFGSGTLEQANQK